MKLTNEEIRQIWLDSKPADDQRLSYKFANAIEAALSAKHGEQALQDVSDPAPSVNAKTLTNEQIDELWRKSCSLEGFSTAQFVRHFARAAIAAVEALK